MSIGLNLGLELGFHGLLHLRRGVGPDAHLLLAALAVGDDAPAELVSTLSACASCLSRISLLQLRRLDVVDRDGEAALRGVAVAEVLHRVERVATTPLA
jgi:hypothetical protein